MSIHTDDFAPAPPKRAISAAPLSLHEEAMERAVQAGAITGKVSGAGGGGFIIFAVEPTKRLQVKRALNQLDGNIVEFQFSEGGTHGWKIFH